MRTSEIVNLFPDTDFHAVPAVLDHLSAGVALLDRRLHVQFANKAFRAMTNDGALALRGRTLSSAWPASARQFDRMTRSALSGAPGGTMAIPHPGDGRLITILVTPAQGRTLDSSRARGSRQRGDHLHARSGPATGAAAAWIMDAYKLTRAEAQVALQASLGHSVSTIGIRLEISPNTVKTHLRRVFAKTGVRGQAELVGLLSALRSVRGDDCGA